MDKLVWKLRRNSSESVGRALRKLKGYASGLLAGQQGTNCVSLQGRQNMYIKETGGVSQNARKEEEELACEKINGS